MFILVAVNNKTLQKTVLNGKMLSYYWVAKPSRNLGFTPQVDLYLCCVSHSVYWSRIYLKFACLSGK